MDLYKRDKTLYNKDMSKLSPQLKQMIHDSVATFGEVIKLKLGQEGFEFIEKLRMEMTSGRGKKVDFSSLFNRLNQTNKVNNKDLAKSFTLMLELMNSVEMSYRRFKHQFPQHSFYEKKPEAIVFVLTAHPTEARHPKNIQIFSEISDLLIKAFNQGFSLETKRKLFAKLDQAWERDLVRHKKPKVEDEARLIHSLVFKEEIIYQILESSATQVPIYLRSWVGGDKDGHPGVNEEVMNNVLNISREHVLKVLSKELKEFKQENSGFKLDKIKQALKSVKEVQAGDYKKIESLKIEVDKLEQESFNQKGYLVPSLVNIKRLFHLFPALVVPLEFRESSDVVNELTDKDNLSLMLKRISAISKGGNPKFYIRGLIISMTKKAEDLLAAAKLIEKHFGEISVPVVPLFEQKEDLEESVSIMTSFFNFKEIKESLSKLGNQQEVMLGYSDSAKQAGVLTSRFLVQKTMKSLEDLFVSKNIKPIFFHGSGGSVDRGGGAILDQTKSWTKTALNFYKVTIQGEMVERQFASSEIFKSQIDKILQAYNDFSSDKTPSSPALEKLVEASSKKYQSELNNPLFLKLIDEATPYNHLSALKFGSRPTKRAKQLSVGSLRAIPWILCWTQTRILFPFWFGVGTAWSELSSPEKEEVRSKYKLNPAALTYFRVLSHTLDKVQEDLFDLYRQELSSVEDRFHQELSLVRDMLVYLEVENTKPWLSESIYLRNPMIHPLNILQIIALKNKDYELFRTTVAGISFGMMATG